VNWKPLLAPVEPFPGESLCSLLHRAGHLNGYPKIADLWRRAAGERATNHPESIPFSSNVDVRNRLASLLRLDESRLRSLMHSTIKREGLSDSVEFNGTLLPRRFVEHRRRRYSPASLRATKFGRQIWSVRALEFCPDSMEFLAETCLSGHELGWREFRGIHVCDVCGTSLTKTRPGKIDWVLREDVRAATALIQPEEVVRRAALQKLPSPFCGWEPGDVFTAVVELGTVLRELRLAGNPESAVEARVSLSPNDLVAGYRQIAAWPTSFCELLRRVVDGRSGSRKALLGPLAKFGARGNAVTPINQLVRQLVPDLLRSDAITLGAYRGVRCTWLAGDTLISEKQAGTKFEVSRRIIGRLSGRGKSFVSRRSEAQGASLYQAEMLSTSCDLWKRSVRTHECGSALGVPAYCISVFAKENLLESIQDEDAVLMACEPIYTRASLDRLVGHFGDLEKCSTPSRGEPLATLLRGYLDPQAWAALVKAVVEGRVPAQRSSDLQPPVLERAFIERSAAVVLLGQLAPCALPRDAVVSCLGAQKALGISNVLLSKTVRAGLLKAETGKGGAKMIRLSDLDQFNRTYVFGSQVSVQLGIPTPNISSQMEAAEILPAARIFRTPLWKRDDIRKLFPEYSPLIGH
jgi:TniQ protein